MKSSVHHRTVVGEHLTPVGEEGRVIMGAFAVRLQPSPHENVHAFGVLALYGGSVGGHLRHHVARAEAKHQAGGGAKKQVLKSFVRLLFDDWTQYIYQIQAQG